MPDTNQTVALSASEALALPFLQTAVNIDSARQNLHDTQGLIAVLVDNAMLWTQTKTQFSQNAHALSPDYLKFLQDMSEFMVRSTLLMSKQADPDFLEKLVRINLNMCEQLLAAATEGETAGSA
jgi:hypothetical protein